ncbi:MAG: aspartate-semialdehyde dehydrogenase [Oligoflexia bacterium]|nr:aspartate-semialdehyde dehydrogenase [Oligoflexia bacterium]
MKTPIALLGATGPVGQKVISLLENHPRFEVVELVASDSRIGKNFGETVHWKDEQPLSDRIALLKMKSTSELNSKYIISALPSEIATEVELQLIEKGHIVSSNAASFRMKSDIPLLIPEINPQHLALVDEQKTKGRLITNPNCSTVFLTSAIRPLMDLGQIEHINVVTMQALSGAGYPGVSSYDLLGNIIPHINGEEDKIQEETKRILGEPHKPADFSLTVHVNRVPVVHGHTIVAHIRFKDHISLEKAEHSFKVWKDKWPNFYELHNTKDRPQPARDLHSQDMRVHIGRLKQGGDRQTIGLIALGHNLVRGAAGAAIANLETLNKYLGEL